jgi:hypothetical protein
MAMRRRVSGWFFTVTGLLACPCHLVVTLPLVVALLGGTALGGWMAAHEGAITIGASIYFVGALAVGATLLLVGGGKHASGSRTALLRAAYGRQSRSCCAPLASAGSTGDEAMARACGCAEGFTEPGARHRRGEGEASGTEGGDGIAAVRRRR